jgi:hypothetical protein
MSAIEELLQPEINSIADEWFAVNMDLDQPRSERMAAIVWSSWKWIQALSGFGKPKEHHSSTRKMAGNQ